MDIQNMQITEADAVSYDTATQILKASVQYVDASTAKVFAVIAKWMELQNLLHYLEKSNAVSACSNNSRQIPPEEMIKDLRKYCQPKDQEQLDKLLNLLNMAKMYEVYKNVSESFSENNYLQQMQSMLTPEQMQLLNNMSQRQ